ncbi:MAG: transcriptional activator domain-containing protein, partial [Baekduiaceae bacterium]
PPATLRGAVRADAAHLAPEARRLADLLAIAGRDLTAPEIDALALADRDDALRAGVEAGLLRGSEGRVGFRHTLLRDAMAHDLPTDRRASLHEQLAAALARVDQQRPAPARSAEIAHHLRAAGRDADAVGQLRNAAAQARALGAMPETLAFLSEAVQLAPSRPDLRLEYAAALAWLGREEAASEQFDRALRDIPPGDAVGKAAAWVARGNWYRSSLCVPHRALPAFRQALGEIDIAREDVPREIRIQALAGAAWAEALIGDVAQVDALIAEIREIAGPHCDDDEVVHEIGHARSTVLIRLGRFAESYAPAEESAEAALRVGRLDMAYGALGNAACAAACAGDLERALRFADRLERAARDSAPPVHAEVLATRAILLARMGRHDEARAEITREEDLVRELGDPVMQATAAFDHGIVALAAGEDAVAADLLDRALRGGAKCSRASARLARAEALTHLERCDEAEAELRATALEPVGPADQPDTLVPRMARLQGLIAAQRGDRDLAERRLREAVDGWRRVAGDRDGERYAALLMDVGRLPLGGMVMPAQELERAEHDLEALDAVVR